MSYTNMKYKPKPTVASDRKKVTNTINAGARRSPALRNIQTERRLRGKVLVPKVPKKSFR